MLKMDDKNYMVIHEAGAGKYYESSNIQHLFYLRYIQHNLQHIPFQNRALFPRSIKRNELIWIIDFSAYIPKPLKISWCKSTCHFTNGFARLFCFVDLKNIRYIYLIFVFLSKLFSSQKIF